jgi:hypothetical protein
LLTLTSTKRQFSTHSCLKTSKSSYRIKPSKLCSKERKPRKKTRKGLISWRNRGERKRKKKLQNEQNCSRKRKLRDCSSKERRTTTTETKEDLPFRLHHLLFKRNKMKRLNKRHLRCQTKLTKFK